MNTYIDTLKIMGITYIGDSLNPEPQAKELFKALTYAYYEESYPRWWGDVWDQIHPEWQVQDLGGLAKNYEQWLATQF